MGSTAIIQLLLVLGVALTVLSFLRNRNAMRFQAGKKLLFALFTLGCVASIVNPELLTRIANKVGVGRGADLVLYALVVAFAFVSLNTYLKFKDVEARMTLLARRLAIAQAVSERATSGVATERTEPRIPD
ncbi:MAG: DUF2304 domain-containing protein [Mycobacteriales bacterium]